MSALKNFVVEAPTLDVAIHKARDMAASWMREAFYEQSQTMMATGTIGTTEIPGTADLVLVGVKVYIAPHTDKYEDDPPTFEFELRRSS